MLAMRFSLRSIALLLAMALAFGSTRLSAQSLPIEINQNHAPAGVLRDGVLAVELVIANGEWHPTQTLSFVPTVPGAT